MKLSGFPTSRDYFNEKLCVFSLSSINSVKADMASLYQGLPLMNIKAQVIQFKGYRVSLVQEVIFHEKPRFYIHQSSINSVKAHTVTLLKGLFTSLIYIKAQLIKIKTQMASLCQEIIGIRMPALIREMILPTI